MPEWNDLGIVLSAKKYGEKGLVINILTENHGRYLGWLNYYKNKSVLADVQPGNLVNVFWKSRLIEQMGKFKIEYFEPIQEVISADGTFMYKLDLELEQLDVVPQEDVFEGTPISLFTSTIQDLNDLYTVKPCIELEDILMCEILPKSEDSFLEKLYINFKDSSLHSLKYLDSFDQTVQLNFDRVTWLPFEDSELIISVPEGIDVVYH